jgi:hypothetical protein
MDEWMLARRMLLIWSIDLGYDKRLTKYMLEQIERQIPEGIVWKPFGATDWKSGDFKTWMIMQVAFDKRAPEDVVYPWRKQLENLPQEEVLWRD